MPATKVNYLGEGPTEERAAVVVDALSPGWTLRQSEPYGAHLIDPDYDQISVVPRDVMEHLIRHDIIELEREQ
jgi:hypothetical protein